MKNFYWLIIGLSIILIIFGFIYLKDFQALDSQTEPRGEKDIGHLNSENESENKELIKEFPTEKKNLDLAIDERVSLVAVGDIMLSRNVAQKMRQHQDYRYPFLKMANFLKKADITFGNLETAITPGRIIQTGDMVFRTDPEAVEGLKYAGFDVLSLANNHTPNFGEKGLTDTFDYLKEVGISYVGAGNNISEAASPVIKEVRGIKFAFLAYNDSDVVPSYYQATKTRIGTAFMNIDRMVADVKQAKQKADFVIVSMHSGTEYTLKPNLRQINFAHQAIDAGANLVLGHHPHVIQTFEKYKDGYIFYSLGNFVFDQMWSQNTREGLIIEAVFNKTKIVGIEFYPVIIEDFSQPRFADRNETNKILKRLGTNFQQQPVFYWKDKDYRQNQRQGIYLDNQSFSRKLEQEEDIDGDGKIEKAIIKNNILYIHNDNQVIWQSNPEWRVENVILADIDNDGKIDIITSVWKMGKYGPDLPFWIKENINEWGNHLFIYKWEDNGVKLFWGSSTIDAPIKEMAVEDVNNDGQNDLVVLEGDYQEPVDELADYLTVWHWDEWSFYNDFRSKKGKFYDLKIKDFGDKKIIYVKSRHH